MLHMFEEVLFNCRSGTVTVVLQCWLPDADALRRMAMTASELAK